MKRLIKTLAALVAASAVFAACQTAPAESVEESAALVPQVVQFTAGVPETRTAFSMPDGDTYPVVWTKKPIKIFPDKFNEHATATVTPADGGKTALFTTKVNVTPASTYTFYLLSPDCLVANDKAAHLCYFNLPEVQQPYPNSVSEDAMILVAKSAAVTSLKEPVSFGEVKHWTAYIKLSLTNLTADIGQLSAVEISAEKPISGYWSYQYDTEQTAVYGGGSKRIEARTSSPTDIWFGIAPVDLGGKELTVKAIGADGCVTRTITLPEGKKFESGKVAIFSVDMKDATDPTAGEVYEQVSEVRYVTEGTRLVILTTVGNQCYAMGTKQENGYRPGVPISKSGLPTKAGEDEYVVDPAEDVEVVTLEPGTTSGTWALRTKAGEYLALEKGKNGLVSISEKTSLSDWRVRFDSDGVPEVRNNTQTTTYYLRYRKSDNHFMGIQSSMQGNLEPLDLFRNNTSGGDVVKEDPDLRLSKKSLTLNEGETTYLSVAVCRSLSDGGVVTFESRDPSVASIDANGTVSALKAGRTVLFARVGETENYRAATDSCAVTVKMTAADPQWVELAPGLKWATFNVGAKTPEDVGGYFAWAETEPKEDYGWWGTYLYMTPGYNTGNGISRYQIPDRSHVACWYEKNALASGYVFIGDGKSTFVDYDFQDDAARQAWGGEWNTPSSQQLDWLKKNGTWTWDEARKGFLVTSKVSGYTSNSIFLPAAGRKESDKLATKIYEEGYYMSSQLTTTTSAETILRFTRTAPFNSSTSIPRYIGVSVRPVYGWVPVSELAMDIADIEIELGYSTDICALFTPEYASDPRVVWSCSDETVVSVTASFNRAHIETLKGGTVTVTARTPDGSKTAFCRIRVKGDEPEPEWVEMAPGLKWATFNVGAESPEEPGSLFAWGEVTKKDYYDWNTYRFMTSGYDYWHGISDYQIDDGNTNSVWYKPVEGTDGFLFVGDGNSAFKDRAYEDDAAFYNWDGEWQTPSPAQFQWLLDNCTWTWDDTKKGYKVTSNVSGYTSKSIFLPAAGNRVRDIYTSPGDYGAYMSNCLGDVTQNFECLRFIKSSGVLSMDGMLRRNGISVRPVYGTVPVTGISMKQSTLSMSSGNGLWLDYNLIPAYASDSRVDFTTSDPSVVALESKSPRFCYIRAKKAGTAVITARTKDGGKTATCTVTVSAQPYRAVDLGLSVKWASKNVGAASEEDYGSYFAWGETYPETGTRTGWDTYKYGSGENAITKYVLEEQFGTVDNYRRLFPSDDAARANAGSTWRMPTENEYNELLENCEISSKTVNGVAGFEVKGPNGATIFIPSAGMLADYGMYDVGQAACFWTATTNTGNNARGVSGYFKTVDGKINKTYGQSWRYVGIPVRPVDASQDIPVSSWSINYPTLNLNVGETKQLGLLYTPNNANVWDIIWSSDNPSVATVDAWGKVTAVKNGKARILGRAYMGDASVSCDVTVGTEPVLKLQIAMSHTAVNWTDYTGPYQLGYISQEYFFRLYDTANDKVVTEGEFSKGSSFTAQNMTQADYDSSVAGTYFNVWGGYFWRVVLRTDGFLGGTLIYKDPTYGTTFEQEAVVYYPRPLALAQTSYTSTPLVNGETVSAKVGKALYLYLRHKNKARSEIVDKNYLTFSGGDSSIASLSLSENSREIVVTPKKAGTTTWTVKYDHFGVNLNLRVTIQVTN